MEIIHFPIRKFNLFNEKRLRGSVKCPRCFAGYYPICYRYITSPNGKRVKEECPLDYKRSAGFCIIRTLIYKEYIGQSKNLLVWFRRK